MKNILNFAFLNVFTLALCIFAILIMAIAIGDWIVRTQNKTKLSFNSAKFVTAIAAAVSCILSVFCFMLSDIWIEYPGNKTTWYKDEGNRWAKTTTRIQHAPFGFNGYHVGTKDLKSHEVSLAENSPFTVTYHIDEANLPTLFDKINSDGRSGCGCGEVLSICNEIIRKKSYELFWKNQMSAMADDAVRNEIFRKWYAPYGITIDSVNFP